MSSLSQFVGSVPVGTIIEAPYSFGVTNTDYLLCDHTKVVRATYPKLSEQYPSAFGTFTPTVRTLNSLPSSNAGASNGTIWAVAGVAGVTAIQTSPDGVTWTNRTTPADANVRSILWLGGTRWAAMRADVGAQPLYSSDNAVTWTAASGAVVTDSGAYQCCAAYASTIGASGRIVLAVGTTSVYTSDDFGVTYTVRATGLGVNVFNVCWTGTRFVATTTSTTAVAVSTDGITWTSVLTPVALTAATASTGFIASDGAGRVVITSNASLAGQYGIFVSQDSGATWSQRLLPSYVGSTYFGLQTTLFPSFTNGLFFLSGNSSGGVVSADLKTFITVSDVNVLQVYGNVISNAGIYLCAKASVTVPTLVNDTTKMYLPGQVTAAPSSGSYALTSHPQWIKAK